VIKLGIREEKKNEVPRKKERRTSDAYWFSNKEPGETWSTVFLQTLHLGSTRKGTGNPLGGSIFWINLVQWLRWVFATQERKEKKVRITRRCCIGVEGLSFLPNSIEYLIMDYCTHISTRPNLDILGARCPGRRPCPSFRMFYVFTCSSECLLCMYVVLVSVLLLGWSMICCRGLRVLGIYPKGYRHRSGISLHDMTVLCLEDTRALGL